MPETGPEGAGPRTRWSSPRFRAAARRASRAPSPIRRATLKAGPKPEQPKLERRQAAPAERRAVAVRCDDRSGATEGRRNESSPESGVWSGPARPGLASSPRQLVPGAPHRAGRLRLEAEADSQRGQELRYARHPIKTRITVCQPGPGLPPRNPSGLCRPAYEQRGKASWAGSTPSPFFV